MTRQVFVDIVGDSSKFSKATSEATASAGKFSGAMVGVTAGITSGVFGLATDALQGFIGSLGEAQEAYRADQVSQATLANTLKNTIPNWDGNTAAIEDFASAQARLGFEDDAVRQSIAQLVGITHDQEQAMRLTSLAEDLARSKGIDLAQATDIVTKAAQGNGKALKSLGVDIGDATDAAGMLDAIQKNVTGSAETWAATSEGKAAVANVKQAESWEKIGSVVSRITDAVLPIAADLFSSLADIILDVADAVQPVVEQLVTNLTPTFQSIASFVTGTLVPAVKTIIGAWWDFEQTVFTVFSQVAGVVSGVISTWWDFEMTVLGIFGNIGAAIGDFVGYIWSIPGQIAGALYNMFAPMWQGFRDAINGIIGGWNSLQFTVPSIDLPLIGTVGGFTIGVPSIPYLHSGGIVPGVPGSDVLAMLQAGERVVPRGQIGSGGTVININIDQGAYIDGPSVDRLANLITQRLRLAGVA